MWQAERTQLDRGSTELVEISSDSAPLSYRSALKLLCNKDTFRTFLSSTLLQSPFKAFRWELPALTNENSAQSFQFALHDAPYLCVNSDCETFAEHFKSDPSASVVVFGNLGGDATLVVPSPDTQQNNFAHFAAFLRNASDQQTQQLWKEVGRTGLARVGKKPLWISTAGDGVAWLHIRLDSRPKYYQHLPFRSCEHKAI